MYCRLTVFPDSGKSIDLTWLKTLMGQNLPWVSGILVYGVKIERREDGFNQSLIYSYIQSLISLSLYFYLPVFNPVTKRNLLLGRKIIGSWGAFAPAR
jgi:hypothetical protein